MYWFVCYINASAVHFTAFMNKNSILDNQTNNKYIQKIDLKQKLPINELILNESVDHDEDFLLRFVEFDKKN